MRLSIQLPPWSATQAATICTKPGRSAPITVMTRLSIMAGKYTGYTSAGNPLLPSAGSAGLGPQGQREYLGRRIAIERDVHQGRLIGPDEFRVLRRENRNTSFRIAVADSLGNGRSRDAHFHPRLRF